LRNVLASSLAELGTTLLTFYVLLKKYVFST
jgi:hypothetical protein